jgi:DNA-binding CsgD family transcriptional regulator
MTISELRRSEKTFVFYHQGQEHSLICLTHRENQALEYFVQNPLRKRSEVAVEMNIKNRTLSQTLHNVQAKWLLILYDDFENINPNERMILMMEIYEVYKME